MYKIHVNDHTIFIAFVTFMFKKLYKKYFIKFNNASIIHVTFMFLKQVYKKKILINNININEKVIIKKKYYYI